MSDKKNIVWINALKAICIIAVFFVHCQSYYGTWLGGVNQYVHTFYVNAFFFVSGYLLFWKQLSEPRINEDLGKYIAGSGKTLFLNVLYRIVIPSILFGVIEFLPSSIIQGREIDIGKTLYKTIGGGTYWFTSALTVAELVMLTLLILRKKSIWFYVSVSIVLGSIGVVIGHYNLLHGVWAWRQGLIAMIFLALGGLYWKYEMQIDQMMKWWFALLMIVVYVLIIRYCHYTNPLISTLAIEPLGFITSAIACMLLVWFSKLLPEVKTLVYIGQNSLGFYFMSGALPICLSLVIHKLIPSSSICIMIIIWCACLLLALLVVVLINRWMPWVWDFRKFNR